MLYWAARHLTKLIWPIPKTEKEQPPITPYNSPASTMTSSTNGEEDKDSMYLIYDELSDTTTYVDDGILMTEDDTTDAGSDIYNSEVDFGRIYATREYGGNYHAFPIDEQEQEQEKLRHMLTESLLGGLFLAPISENSKVLDMGTGTGYWATDCENFHKIISAELTNLVGAQYPKSTVLGIDCFPACPTRVPCNTNFRIDDLENEWLSDNFHYIHGRFLAGSFTDWDFLLSQVFK
jgi:hypothetical protein